MDTTWAELVRALEGRGWSLTEIGKAIGKSPQTVSDIKQGRNKGPGGMAAVRLHQIYSTGELPAPSGPAATGEAPHAA